MKKLLTISIILTLLVIGMAQVGSWTKAQITANTTTQTANILEVD